MSKKCVQISVAWLKASLVIAAKGDIRYYLNGVLVEVGLRDVRIVACDGHRLSVLRRESHKADADNAPANIIIPREVIAGIKAAKGAVDCVLEYDAENTLGECTLKMIADASRSFMPIGGKFPDYLRVIPSTISGERGGMLNPYYSADWATFVNVAFNGGKKSTSLFPNFFDNGNNGAPVTMNGHPEFIGVLMPMRSERGEYMMPTWLAQATTTA